MIPHVTAPNVGTGLRASWGASVAGAINALAAGLETRAKPLENQRNRRGGNEQIEDHDTQYGADEHSVSLVETPVGSGVEQDIMGNHFHLKGFGKFAIKTGESGAIEKGSYVPPSKLTLDQYENGGTSVALLVRAGNSPAVDTNSLEYKRLVFRSHSEPFLYTCTTGYNQQTGEALENPIRTFENCVFYFDGVEQWIDPIQPPINGTVYLVSTKDASGVWMHEMSEAPGTAPEGGDVINIKLYDFEAGKVTVDYRSVSLCVSSAKVDKSLSFNGQEVAKIAASANVEITQKTLVAGEGIKLEPQEDGSIMISVKEAKSGFAGTIDYVCDVKYDTSDYCLKKLMAHTNFATGKTTFGSNYSATKSGGTWELFAEGAQTVPMT